MLREFVQLVSEAVDDGFNRGLNLFMENLEEDLAKSEILSEVTIDQVISEMLTTDGFEVDIIQEDDLEDLDETKIDAMLEQMEKEGLA